MLSGVNRVRLLVILNRFHNHDNATKLNENRSRTLRHVSPAGVELTTSRLPAQCSTTEPPVIASVKQVRNPCDIVAINRSQFKYTILSKSENDIVAAEVLAGVAAAAAQAVTAAPAAAQW